MVSRSPIAASRRLLALVQFQVTVPPLCLDCLFSAAVATDADTITTVTVTARMMIVHVQRASWSNQLDVVRRLICYCVQFRPRV